MPCRPPPSTLFPYTTLFRSGFRRAFTWMAQQAPLVVVLDGVHWADAQSLDVLSGLVRHADSLPILFLLVTRPDRKSTRLNSSHLGISYAVFCLKKKKQKQCRERLRNKKYISQILAHNVARRP